MVHFPKYYTHLFNSVTDALEALQKQNYIKAQDILIRAQQEAEEMYLEDGDEEDEDAEEEDLSEYIPMYKLLPIIEELRRLEMQILLHESDEAFQMLIQEKETRPEDPDCEKAEIG